MDISIVVPLFNEEESLPELVGWIEQVLKNSYTYEVILVDDGSRDNSWDVIEQLALAKKWVKGISFSRNYGKSAALYKGFEAAQGNVVITLDADLQDSPEEIPELYRMVTEDGYDVVSGWKKDRHDPTLSKRLPSKLYNATVRLVTHIKLHDFNSGIKAYKRKVVKSIEVYGEMHRYIPVLAKQAGFTKIGEKVVKHQARKYGKTKFGMNRFINGFLDLLSVVFVTKFGKKPMHFFGLIGTLMFLAGGVITVWLIIRKICDSSQGLAFRQVTDQPLFYLALLAIILGVMLFLAGFLGELITRSSSERNVYLVDKTTNVSKAEAQIN